MALRCAALAALVVMSGCERLPDGPAPVRWERELRVEGLARASDGDLFVTADGTLSRLDPDGETRWSISGDYRYELAVSPNDEIAVVSINRSAENASATLFLLDGADGAPIFSLAIESIGPFKTDLHGFAPLAELVAVVGADTHEDPDTGEVLSDSTSFIRLFDRDAALVKQIEFPRSVEHTIVRDPRGGFIVIDWGAEGDTDLGLGPIAPGETEVTLLARFDEEGELMAQHLGPQFVGHHVIIGEDGAMYFTAAAHPGDPGGVLMRAGETGAIEWQVSIHGADTDYAYTYCAGVGGDVVYAAGHLDGTPGFGRLPDPEESGTGQLPPEQKGFLLSVDAATGAIRWQRGLPDSVNVGPPMVVDAGRGFYLSERRPDFTVLAAREAD